MENFNYFIGVDVSKETLDFCVLKNEMKVIETKVVNQKKAIDAYLKKLITEKEIDFGTSVFCMEHTGLYNNHLLKVLVDNNFNIWLENPIHLKRSMGLVRGKNDKVDAGRIALFAYKNRDNVKLWHPEREVILKLKSLLKARERLMDAVESIENPLKESSRFVDKETIRLLKHSCGSSINALRKDIKKTDLTIKEVLNSDEQIKSLFNIISSVDNVGTIIATAVIVYTNEFKKINNPKKFACYSGIAPFEHTSGKCIRGKTRVSFMANKYLKKLFHLSAIGAISRPGELRIYFERKVAEGKNKMLVLNAIRNKIILRIFACVNQNRVFEKNIKNCLVSV
jgi:transposase